MFILIKSYFGEVLKWLKSLASNTSRPVTRREGSNPSFSAEKGNAKTAFVLHSLFIYFTQTDLPHHTPEPRTNLQVSALLPFGYPASSVHTTAPCAEMFSIPLIIGKAPYCPKSILAKDNNSSPSPRDCNSFVRPYKCSHSLLKLISGFIIKVFPITMLRQMAVRKT